MKIVMMLIVMMLSMGFVSSVSAADGCPSGYTKLAAKWYGNQNWPSTCKLNTCRPIGMIEASSIQKYEAWEGSAPSNACPSSVNSATWLMDGCQSGTTKRAIKLAGNSSYASVCKIATCQLINRYSAKADSIAFLWLYKSENGQTWPHQACLAAVSTGPWVFSQ